MFNANDNENAFLQRIFLERFKCAFTMKVKGLRPDVSQ